MTRLGVRSAFVDGEFVPGDVDVAGGVITAVGLAPAGGDAVALPGFVDLQVNGFAGVDFTRAGADEYRTAGEALVSTGVTSYLATLVTMPLSEYAPALAAVADVVSSGRGPRVLGAHLEGPFLSPLRAGAHDPGLMIDPDPRVMETLLGAGPVRHVTLAPELEGAMEMIDLLRGRGVTVSCGHSDATAEVARAAFDRGAAAVTHLFNAQRPFGHRDPGLAGAALAHDTVVVTVIADGVHVAPDALRVAAWAARGRLALITDAVAAAGLPDGASSLGESAVHRRAGEVRLHDGTLAGSVVTMDAALRNLIDLGIAAADAVGAATVVPARLTGRPELGTLRPGTPADIAVVDGDWSVVRTLVGGRVVHG